MVSTKHLGPRFACAVAIVALLSLVSGCGADSASRRGHEVAQLDGASAFPAESMTDWRSYADHLVTVTVTDERELPPSPVVLEDHAGLIGREVTLRVDEVIWSAPNAPDLGCEIRVREAGWILRDGVR